MSETKNHTTAKGNAMLQKLEQLVAESCACKLRTHCLDKTSPECFQHRNFFAEAMQARDKNLL